MSGTGVDVPWEIWWPPPPPLEEMDVEVEGEEGVK